MTGNLNWADFQSEALKFVQLSDKLEDGWTILHAQGYIQGEPILYLEKRCFLSDSDTTTQDIASEDVALLEDDKLVQISASRNGTYLQATYHVVHSQSYEVPVLYFKLVRSDGRPLCLEELWQRVPAAFRTQLEAQKWSMLTQQEHPLLGLPFHCLHPCYTAALMKCTEYDRRTNYLVTWLSSVGPVVGLHLTLAYARQQDVSLKNK